MSSEWQEQLYTDIFAQINCWSVDLTPVEIRETLERILRELRLRAIADRDPARTTSERAADGLMGSP